MPPVLRSVAVLLTLILTGTGIGSGAALAEPAPAPDQSTPPSVTVPNPSTTWTPPPEPALQPVTASPCQDDPTVRTATCLSEVDGTVPDASAAAVGKADAAATSDTETAPLPPAAVPQAASKSGSYSPADLASIYKIPAGLSTDATIGIVDVGSDPNTAAQLSYYRSYFGLPACTTANGCFREVGQSGGAALPPTNSSWVTEIALDVQAVSAVCPSCHILLVDANSASASDLGAAATTAVRLGAAYVSMSYGSADSGSNTSLNLTYYNSPGVTYVAASGDDGYAGGTIFPSSAANVIAAGGTSVRLVNGTWQQTAWSGAGSGCSSATLLGLVTGLLGSLLTSGSCPSGRAVSDVSALADAATGILFYRGGSWYSGGGTSLAAPIIASLYALAGNHTEPRSVYDNLSAKPGSFLDIVSGANGSCGTVLCTAGPGWDGPTGVGTPAGLSGLLATGAPAVPLATPTTASSLIRGGGGYPVRLAYRLVDALTGAPVAGAPVVVQADTGGGFAAAATTQTGPDGSLGYVAQPRTPTTYRIFYAGDATHGPSTSTSVAVRTFTPTVRVTRSGHRLKAVAKGPWGGAAVRVPLTLQRRAGKHWKTAKHATTSTAGKATLRVHKAGRYRIAYGGGPWATGRTKTVRVR